MPNSVAIITEDALSELVAERIVRASCPGLEISVRLGRKGYNYVVGKLRGLNQAAAGMGVLALLDRDSPGRCPIEVINAALGGARHRNLIVRFAEMEIESWIMGDGERLARFLDVPRNRIPAQPDGVADPKQTLVNIARRSRSRVIRDDLCPSVGSTALVGPAYNERLEAFLREDWRVATAAESSPSLERAVQRVLTLCEE
jgi:hypothetical protein